MLFKLYFIQKTHLIFQIYIYMQIPQLVWYEWWHSSSLSRDIMQFTYICIYLVDNVRVIKNCDWSLFDYEQNSRKLRWYSYLNCTVSSSIYICITKQVTNSFDRFASYNIYDFLSRWRCASSKLAGREINQMN